MAGKRVASFIDNLRDSQLLPSQQLDEVARSPLAQGDDPMPLARELLQRQTLTSYQINQLVRGRGKELSLGAYRLQDRLGEGGMGEVFKAFHQPMNRLVALKVIRKEKLAKPEMVGRFYQEVRAAAQLNHPNVVIAYDAGQANDTHFFAMELVEGIDLAKYVKEKGPLPVAPACAFIRQAALGLQHAHEKGLVHRDIKPANLLLTRAPGAQGFGLVKILDFGLARLQSLGGDNMGNDLTKTGMVVGTPDYLAPEQARNSRSVDIRADLYSLGCTFFYLLAGRPPFKGEHLTEILLQHQSDPPPPLSTFRKDVPAGVQEIVGRLLAKKPDDRYQTPAELAAALAPFAGKAGGKRVAIQVNPSDTLVQSADADTPVVPPAAASATRPLAAPLRILHRWPPRTRWAIVAGLALIPVLGLVLLLAGGKRESRPTEVAQSSAPKPEHADLFADIRAAIKENRLTTSEVYGAFVGKNLVPDVPPDGALLIGFKVGIGRFFNAKYIGSVQPIYLTPQGELLGTRRGKEPGLVLEYKAKKGFAVGAVKIRPGFLAIEDMQITYMPIRMKSLDRNQPTDSEWIAGNGPKDEKTITGDGAPAVGIIARENEGGLTGLGLVFVQRP
jgi:serine/threonine protein kinase